MDMSTSPNRRGSDDIMTDIHGTFRAQGLVRPREGRLIGGVFAGVGRRFGLDPWPSRILFSLLLFLIPGSQILLYPVLWVLMPAEEQPAPSGSGFVPA